MKNILFTKPNCRLILFVILFLLFQFSWKSLLAQSTAQVIVSGAGTVAVNGTYTYSGTSNGRPYFTYGKYRVEYRDGGYGLEWEIWDTNELNTNYEVKYYNASTSQTPPVNTWLIDVASPPAPTVSYIDVAVISTNVASSVSSNSATLGGNVTSNGGSPITSKGIVYSSVDTMPAIGKAGVTQVPIGLGTGSFDTIVNSLTASTKYYVRAYAINAVGTSYGNKINFTTSTITNSKTYAEESIILGPNPAYDWLCINAGSKQVQLIIYDLGGKVLISQVVQGMTNIDVKMLASGIYILKMGKHQIKLIKR